MTVNRLKVITTVGTSLFTNYINGKDSDFKKKYDNIAKETYGDKEKHANDYITIQKILLNAINKKNFREDYKKLAAEINSIMLIEEKYKNFSLKVHFLASDTISSWLAARLITDWFNKKKELGEFANIEFVFNEPDYVINNLQMIDLKKFNKDGLSNLINKIYGIAENNFKDVIFNITGGYKGVIPYVSLLAQIYSCKLVYVFEEALENQSESPLINIPQIPINFDYVEFASYRGFFNYDKIGQKLYNALPAKLKTLFDEQFGDEDDVTKYNVNTIGKSINALYRELKNSDSLDRFGKTPILVDELISCGDNKFSALGEFLKENIETNWRYIFVGDRIPETVEHSRGHSQRLMELMAQIYYQIRGPINLSQLELSILIGAIWLHDIGHSASKYEDFSILFESGKLKINKKDISLSCHDFPHMIREFHNRLSILLLEQSAAHVKGDDKIFPPSIFKNKNKVDKQIFEAWKTGVYILTYGHRKVEIDNLKQLINDNAVIDFFEKFDTDIKFISWLFKVLDGIENNSERIINKSHMLYKFEFIKSELRNLFDEYKIKIDSIKNIEDRDIKENILSSIKELKLAFSDEELDTLNKLITEFPFDNDNKDSNYKQIKKIEDAFFKISNNAENEKDQLIKKIYEIENEKEYHKLIIFNLVKIYSKILFKLRQPKYYNEHSLIDSMSVAIDDLKTNDNEVFLNIKVKFAIEEIHNQKIDIENHFNNVKSDIFKEFDNSITDNDSDGSKKSIARKNGKKIYFNIVKEY